jgi:amino acid adenylation domain-containing protein
VGICVERSLEMMIGLFGILKAGGAYLPLDPAYPAARLAFMLEDASVSVLLTQSGLVDKLSSLKLSSLNSPMVCLDTESEQLSEKSSDNPDNGVQPTNLVYVIYTSGSTGRSKGVMVNHRSLVNAYQAWKNAYLITDTTSHLQMANFSFDVFTGDWVRCLCSGAKLVLCPRQWLLEADKLYQLMVKEQVDCAEFVPAVIRHLIQYLEETAQNLHFMKLLIVGSDSWYVQEYKKYQRFLSPQTRLINSYGVTETTIDSSYFESQQINNLPREGLVPIGLPFANTQIYLLDAYLQPVPIGIPGELYIGGLGLARGYLNRPDLTQEKFISNPLNQEFDSLLYKSGDFARYRPDGNIEYLERLDNQVKIRGFRIEVGEIEAILTQHQAVQENVVVVHEDDSNNKQLIAYLVFHKETVIEIKELRHFLQEKLPDYMIPTVFEPLTTMPLTPTGKIDRQALPAPEAYRGETTNQVGPRDTLELQLIKIWEDVLNVYPIGVHENFFELGGHSLLAIKLMTKIGQLQDKHLSLATLFQGATIEQLANFLRQQSDKETWSSLVPIQANGSKTPFFGVPGAGGNILYFYELVNHLDQDQPFYALQSVGLDGESAPYTRIEDMATHYIKEIQVVQPQGPYLLGGHSLGAEVTFEMSQQLQKQGQEVALLVVLDSIAPFTTAYPTTDEPDNADTLRYIIKVVKQYLGNKLEISDDELKPLTAEEQLNTLKERLIRANWLPPEVELKQFRGYVEVFKANLQTQYVPKNPLKVPRIAFFKAHDVDFQLEDVQNEEISKIESEMKNEPTWGWNKFSDNVTIHIVPGNHLTMITEPHVPKLAEQLKICIEQAFNKP